MLQYYRIPEYAETKVEVSNIIYNSFYKTLTHYIKINGNPVALVFHPAKSKKAFGFDVMNGDLPIRMFEGDVYGRGIDLHDSDASDHVLPDKVYLAIISTCSIVNSLRERRDEIIEGINSMVQKYRR